MSARFELCREGGKMGEINDIQVTVLDEPGEYPKGVSLEKSLKIFRPDIRIGLLWHGSTEN